MARTVELLLVENVEGTGIVGDVVKVRKGFARNYLLPRSMATQPSPEKVKELAGKRADAEKQLAELRKQREAIIGKLEGFTVEMIRSCNDMGILYGSITQREIATVLAKAGFPGIKDREVRIASAMKRIDVYDIDIKFASDLVATIRLDIKPDRPLDLKRFDSSAASEIDALTPAEKNAKDKSAKADKAEGDGEAEEKPAKAEKGEGKAEKKAKGDKGDKADKGEKPEAASKSVWATNKSEAAAKAEKAEKSEKGEGKGKKGK